jgi:hypothetical protein
MKKTALLLLLLTAGMAQAQVTKNVGDFTELKVFDRITVTLIPSTENKVEASGNRSEDVEVVNKDGKLKIRLKMKKLLAGEDVNAKVYFTKLTSVDASEGAMITASATLNMPNLMVTAKEGAQIELNLDVTSVDIKSVTGGIVRLAGTADRMKVSMGTGGVLEAKPLKTRTVQISINAGGEAKITATDFVDATVNAGGNVEVYGNPKKVKQDTNLGGNVDVMK